MVIGDRTKPLLGNKRGLGKPRARKPLDQLSESYREKRIKNMQGICREKACYAPLDGLRYCTYHLQYNRLYDSRRSRRTVPRRRKPPYRCWRCKAPAREWPEGVANCDACCAQLRIYYYAKKLSSPGKAPTIGRRNPLNKTLDISR